MKYLKIAAVVSLIVAAVALAPLAVIWSLNILFPALAIAYTFDSWCAVVLLHAFMQGVIRIQRVNN